jgi:hypothetical protein
MATPITWQNINAPDLASASRPLEAAQRSFSTAFDGLGQLLTERQRIGEQNWQNTRINNTNAFLDKLMAFRTPEELAAAQQSGALNQLRQQFGAQIDTAAIRGAEESRLNQLRTGVKQAGEYQDWSTDRAQAGTKDRIKSLIAAGKFDDANALLQQNELRNESDLELGLRNMRRQVTVEGQQDTRFNNDQTRFSWDTQLQPLVVQAKQVDIAQGNQSIAESKARVTHMGEQTKGQRAANAAAAKLAASAGDKAFVEEKQNGAYSLGAYGTKEGNEALYAGLKSIPGLDDRDKEDIVYNLQKYYKDGITVQGKDGASKLPLPVSAILQAIEGSSDNLAAIGFSRRGDHVAELIAERFGLLTSLGQDYNKPSRNYATKADMELINSMKYYQDELAKRQQRAAEKVEVADKRAKDGKVPNDLR